MEYKNRMGRRLQIRKIKELLTFPSLFSKLFFVYLGILIITFIVFFMIFSTAFKSYFVNYTQEIMVRQAENIADDFAQIGVPGVSTGAVFNNLNYKIQVLDSYIDATTWLVDRNYTITVVSENSQVPVDKTIPQAEIIQSVFDGNIVKIRDGFQEYFTTPVITIGYPIEIFGEVEYALFIHTPMPEILKTINEVTEITLQVVGITMLLVFAWIYLFSRQMSKPLKEMNTIAQKIAGGQFDKRVKVKGNDEIAQLGESLNYMATELDKIEEKRKVFIGNISHDLRSPLTSIQGFITAILDETIPYDQQEKYLKKVLTESKRMVNMINDILELNKMEQKDMEIHKYKFNLNSLIKDCITNFEARARDKNVKFELDLEEKQIYAFGDKELIIRVLQNLVDNAVKFVNENGIVQVRTHIRQGKIWVHIKNTGSSLSKEEQLVIWDRFYKGDYSRSKDKTGTGLGLVIVKEIINKHEEKVGVISSEEEGKKTVEFYFSLQKG